MLKMTREISFVVENLIDCCLLGFLGGIKSLFADILKFMIVLLGLFGIFQGLFDIFDRSSGARPAVPAAPPPEQSPLPPPNPESSK